MKILILSAAVAATIFAVAAPASAEVVVRERMGVHHDNGWHKGWRNHHADCRTVRVKTRLPNGNVIVKTRRSC